jgi:hypothetical protein
MLTSVTKIARSIPAEAVGFFGFVIYVEVGITGQIDRPFLDRNSALH